ncbi:rhomboid family intramembrane serine protease [Thioclava kandeliae]|uniref:Rhomboid family intramembrane serine protease n=1 Tax=Thioclava kandeliae TaxID=3070818 RepID=A0ABV1SLS5_9RHOB
MSGKLRRLWPIWGIAFICLLPEFLIRTSTLWLGTGTGGTPTYLRGVLVQNFAFWPGLLYGWHANYAFQPEVMFVTYGFLHANFTHIFFNMITLYSLGRALILEGGPRSFVGVYFVSLVGGGVGYAWLASGPLPMVGASGALFGLAGALLWCRLHDDWREISLTEGLKAVFWPVVILVGLNFVMYFAMSGQLAWQTHLGGFISGAIAMAAILSWRRNVRRPNE